MPLFSDCRLVGMSPRSLDRLVCGRCRRQHLTALLGGNVATTNARN
ncbi:MAG: hypothetical protein FWG87_06445 [Defluviitaleaceae bacterium]|nr:hypothetical protein [Defluviitaleaceae bacterium]